MRWQLFDEWQTSIIRPLIVSVLTAAVLFGLAALFRPALQWLFRPDTIEQYPLICFAEPYSKPDADSHELLVDFFIVNPTEKPYSRDALQEKLLLFNPDHDRVYTPDLKLTVTNKARIRDVVVPNEETGFNYGKGEISANPSDDKRSVKITINSIVEHALLKVTMDFVGVLIPPGPVLRSSSVLVPFKFKELQERCYQR